MKTQFSPLLTFIFAIISSCVLIDCATADVFRVQFTGTFQSADESPPLIAPGTPFAGAFLVNTNAAPVLHQDPGGGVIVTGYQDAAISDFSITAGGVIFTKANINDRIAVAGQPGAAVYFSQDLADGASPGVQMFLQSGSSSLAIGDLACGFISGPYCQFLNRLEFGSSSPVFARDTGIVSVQVTSAQATEFAGTPGSANCHGKSVSALSAKFGSLEAAATALSYPSVQALQDAIRKYCRG